MEAVSSKDREILRELATRKLALSKSKRNDDILAMWTKQAKGIRDNPTVRLLFSNFRGEVIKNRLRCEGTDARKLEASLLSSMVGRELFDDDTRKMENNADNQKWWDLVKPVMSPLADRNKDEFWANMDLIFEQD